VAGFPLKWVLLQWWPLFLKARTGWRPRRARDSCRTYPNSPSGPEPRPGCRNPGRQARVWLLQ